jgi:hypothetical protein
MANKSKTTQPDSTSSLEEEEPSCLSCSDLFSKLGTPARGGLNEALNVTDGLTMDVQGFLEMKNL